MSMRIITRTIYGSHLQTAKLLGLQFQTAPNSTLNEKFGVLPNVGLEEGVYPKIGYYCIGNRGHRIITGADGIPYTSPINHRATDAALFNHVPFVLREYTNDLTLQQRSQYGLRRLERHNDIDYIAYYLKRVNTSNVTGEMVHTRVKDGSEQTSEFVPGSNNLNPQPPEMPNEAPITTEGNYLTTSAIIDVDFTEFDVEEYVNVTRILYNTEDRAVISEIGLCTGVDYTTTGESPNGEFNYRDAIAVQIATHINGYYPVGYSNQGFTLQIEAGATEPLLGDEHLGG